jgi:hypothetical protein
MDQVPTSVEAFVTSILVIVLTALDGEEKYSVVELLSLVLVTGLMASSFFRGILTSTASLATFHPSGCAHH